MRVGVSAVSMSAMAARVMFVQLKTGYDTDMGPAWVSWVRFNRSCKTAYWHGKTLRRRPGMFDANFYDVDTDEPYWLSGPHRAEVAHVAGASGAADGCRIRPIDLEPSAETS
jgi:hypothetical protein